MRVHKGISCPCVAANVTDGEDFDLLGRGLARLDCRCFMRSNLILEGVVDSSAGDATAAITSAMCADVDVGLIVILSATGLRGSRGEGRVDALAEGQVGVKGGERNRSEGGRGAIGGISVDNEALLFLCRVGYCTHHA